MNSFLKSMNIKASKRNTLIKESLQKQLSTSIVEMEGASGVAEGNPVTNCEETMTLCSVIEAIFLHGLKDSLLNKVTEVFGGSDLDSMPQPSFWGPLLVFSHRQIIDQIQALSQVSTEVGYCRAWIRLALNDGLLANYFCSIRRDNSALKPYYAPSAYIRDKDLVEVAERAISSLDPIHFNLVCNSSLLNIWSSTPLLLAGIWSPPMKSCPIVSAVDIARTISCDVNNSDSNEEIETASSIGSFGSFASSHSALNNISCLTEDEALKIILTSPDTGYRKINELMKNSKLTTNGNNRVKNSAVAQCKSSDNENSSSSTPKRDVSTDTRDQEELIDDIPDADDKMKDTETADVTIVGNSLVNKVGWSSVEDAESSLTSSMVSQSSSKNGPISPGEGPTYDALIQSYNAGSNSIGPGLKEYLTNHVKREPIIEETKIEPDPQIQITINLDDQLGRIPNEKGLDTQNYTCLECNHAISMTFSKAYVCSYSGDYFCSKCMSTTELLIPSRMIHNWDLKRYPVSQRAAKYLTDCKVLLDLKSLNPRIYSAVDAMAQLQSLRIQLNLLRAYLFTCREPVIESLQQKTAPRDYLYEHVHQYSVSDLLDIPNGTLAQQLQKVVEFARNHVLNCWLCSQKGFICEICNNPKIIYPFDMESTYRCGACSAVFHAKCLNTSKNCPKCERRRKRMDRPLLDLELPNEESASDPIDIV